ncbi:MAG: hypothetical protein K5906_02935 [Bacilli bacterium]|nr:hypothetical protein [Bacilli bacterium]
MINNYCLYYIPKSNEKEVSDMLMIFFGENRLVNKRELNNDIIYLKNNNDVIGYVIINFSTHCKIKVNGTLYLPNNQLIDLINDVLINHHLDTLAYKKESGLVIGRIKNKKEHRKAYIYEIDIKDNIIQTESTFDLPLNTKVVVAKSNTYLMPGRMINDYDTQDKIHLSGRIVTYEDLEMNIENPYYPILLLEEDMDIGVDFFYTEEKLDA